MWGEGEGSVNMKIYKLYRCWKAKILFRFLCFSFVIVVRNLFFFFFPSKTIDSGHLYSIQKTGCLWTRKLLECISDRMWLWIYYSFFPSFTSHFWKTDCIRDIEHLQFNSSRPSLCSQAHNSFRDLYLLLIIPYYWP